MTSGSPEVLEARPERGRGRVAATLGVLIIAAGLAAASLSRVPEGHHAYRRFRGGSAWEVLDPGLRMSLPAIHEVEVVADGFELSDRAAVATREGASAPISWTLIGHCGSSARREAASNAESPSGHIARAAGKALSQASARMPGDRLLSGRADADLAEALRDALVEGGCEIATVSVTTGEQGAPASDSSPPRRRLKNPIVLIGLDGADWQTADPLIESGRLPNLARLKRKGAWGHLRSSTPMLSPLLWTTAATGKPPEDHGIIDFLVPDPASGRRVPIGSSFRKVKALWNIFDGRGLSSAVVGWWATYPAERVNGVIVSDRVAYSLFDVAEAAGSGLVSPASLWFGVKDKIVEATAISDAEVLRLAEVSPPEIALAREASRRRGENASRDRLVHLLKIIAGAKTYHGIALSLIEQGQPDLIAVYYQGIDEVSHRFAHCAPPATAMCPAGAAARYGETVERYYEYQDALLGEILLKIDPASYVIVMSDHGFRAGGDRPRDEAPDIEGKPAKWHRGYGVLLAAGPGVAAGLLENVTLLDVAPTVLRLAGLPAASDMKGRALVQVEGLPSPAPAVASYEREGQPLAAASAAGTETDGIDSSEAGMLENLRSLGYIGGSSEPSGVNPGATRGEADGGMEPGTPSTVTAHTNVGAIHLQKGRTAEAAREFEAALGLAPEYFPALMGLAEARVVEGRLREALALIGRAMESSPDPEPGVYARFATLSGKDASRAAAARTLERLRVTRPREAGIPVALALLAHEEGRAAESEALLRAALSLDPTNTEALSRLFQARKRAGREADLEPEVRRALGMNPGSVMHRNWLGLILQRRGETASAEREYLAALDVAPDFPGTMANIGSLYGRIGRLHEAVTILSRALRIDPSNVECRVNLGAALGKLGRGSEALKVLKEGRSGETSTQPELLNALAVAYAQNGEARRAGDILRESLSISPDQPKIRAMLRELDEMP